MYRSCKMLSWVVGAAACLAVGCGKSQPPSNLSQAKDASAVPATVTASGLDGVSVLYGNNAVLDKADILGAAKLAAERKFATLGVIAAELPQFFAVDANVSKLTGCQVYDQYAFCPGAVTVLVTLTAKAGPDRLDAVAMVASFDSLATAEFHRRLTWTVEALTDQMVGDGLLTSLGIETPYF